MRFIQILIGTIFALSISAGCAYMIYFLTLIPYLPPWLHTLLIVLCAVAIVVTLFIWISSIVSAFLRREE